MCWHCSRLIFGHISSLWDSAEQNAWQCLKMALTTWLQTWQDASCHLSGNLEKMRWEGKKGREEEFSEEQSENRWRWVMAMMLRVMKKTEDWPQRTTKCSKIQSQKKDRLLILHSNCIISFIFLANVLRIPVKRTKLPQAGLISTEQVRFWPHKDPRPLRNNPHQGGSSGSRCGGPPGPGGPLPHRSSQPEGSKLQTSHDNRTVSGSAFPFGELFLGLFISLKRLLHSAALTN